MVLSKKKILAIDDTASIRTFLRISLQSQGASFYEAPTGKAGIDACKELEPHLVVLDLGLPDKDGLEVLSELKDYYKDDMPKIIILTVRKEQSIRQKAFNIGADAFLSKPFIMEDLLEIIHDKLDLDTYREQN